jgi:predicted MFS family arabinose efflux permease
VTDGNVATTFLRWTWVHALLHRGWWLVTTLYLVVVADLTPSELALYGAVLGGTMLLAEIPTGVVADSVSRKWSLVIAHVIKGSGMVMMGLVTDFPLILVTQVLWGLGGTFLSGADVAWVTDELDRPDRIARVLMRRARVEQVGSAAGLVVFGSLAWATDLRTAVIAAGGGMILLGAWVALRFTERNFTPRRADRWRESMAILRRGASLARSDRAILLMFAGTVLVNGATEAYDFLLARQLVDLGLPAEPDRVVWLTALGLVTLVAAAGVLRIVQARIEGVDVARRAYALACLFGAAGLLLLAHAPDHLSGMAGVLLVGGIASPVTRAVSVVWVNERATSDVRATMQSFLAQGEAIGEVSAGVAFGVLARFASLPVVLSASALLFLWAAVMVARSSARRESPLEAGPPN